MGLLQILGIGKYLKKVKEYTDQQIENLVGSAPETLNTLQELSDALKNDAGIVDALNNAILTKADKTTVESIPVVKGDMPNSAVLKGGNNQVISEGGVALGENNFVGLKGWYYSAMYAYDSHIQVLLSHEQKICNEDEQISEPLVLENIDGTLPNLADILGIGTIVSLVNDVKYDNKFKIIDGRNGIVYLETVDGSAIPFDVIKSEIVNDPEDYSIYCLSQPDKGMFDMGQGSIAGGYYNKATNGKSTTFGFNNHAYGKFSFVGGRDNEAGYASCVVGRENKGLADQTFVSGLKNITTGNNSHIEGNKNINRNGVSSHIEGRGNVISENENDLPTSTVGAPGKLNYSHVEGLNNQLRHGHSTHIEGKDNEVYADYSHVENNFNKVGTKTKPVTGVHVEGSRNTVKANGAHVENGDNVIEETATHSHVGGRYNTANNPREFACGVYNKSTKYSDDKSQATHFSIGIGTSDTKRKNAFEVKQNGDIYIEGLSVNLRDYIKSLESRIKELEDIINDITITTK